MFLLASTMLVLFIFSSIAMTNTYFTIFLHTYGGKVNLVRKLGVIKRI